MVVEAAPDDMGVDENVCVWSHDPLASKYFYCSIIKISD